MKLSLALLAIFIFVGALYMHQNMEIQEAVSWDQELDNQLEQSQNLEFRTNDNCRIGSKYKLGEGCADPIFSNEITDEQQTSKLLTSSNLDYFKSSSAIDMMRLMSIRNSFEGGGFGFSIKIKENILNKYIQTSNALSIIITDLRKHLYIQADANQFEIDSYSLKALVENPIRWYEENSYYFVQGYVTGSFFEGTLTYKSENTAALSDVEKSISVSFSIGIMSLGGGHDFKKISETAHGTTEFQVHTNVTGCSNYFWSDTDLYDNHQQFQKTIIKDQMVTVFLTKYEYISKFREALKQIKDQNKQSILRDYFKVSNSFYKKISDAYSNYLWLLQMITETYVSKGYKMSDRNIKILNDYKDKVYERIYKIDNLHGIDQISALYKDNKANSYLEHATLFYEIDSFIKQV